MLNFEYVSPDATELGGERVRTKTCHKTLTLLVDGVWAYGRKVFKKFEYVKFSIIATLMIALIFRCIMAWIS